MSNAGDMPELEPLEEVAAAPAADAQGMTPVSLPGMPAPVFGMRAPKEYYRFFFAGLLIVIGCLMPFGPDMGFVGYKTLGGGIALVIGLLICWSAWVAISHGRFGMNTMIWLMLAVIPLVAQSVNIASAFDAPAVVAYNQAREPVVVAENKYDLDKVMVRNWGELFSQSRAYLRGDPRGDDVGMFFRNYGPGKLFVLVGSLLAELFLLMGFMSGMKRGKQQKAAKEAARASSKGKKGRR